MSGDSLNDLALGLGMDVIDKVTGLNTSSVRQPIKAIASKAFKSYKTQRSQRSSRRYAVQKARTLNFRRSRNQGSYYGGFTGGNYVGKMCKKVSYGKKKLKGRADCIGKNEIKGSVTDPNVTFVGFGVNFQNVWLYAVRAIVKRLFSLAGISILNWDNAIDGTFQIQYTYYSTPVVTAVSARTISPAANASGRVIADDLVADFQAFVLASSAHKIKEFKLLDNTGATLKTIAWMSGSNLDIEVRISQALLVQNVTVSGSSNSSTDSVEANPLFVNVFDSNSNIVYQKERGDFDLLTWLPWTTYNNVWPSVYTRTAAANFPVGQVPNQVAKFFSNAKQTSKSILQPGKMKKIQSFHVYGGNVNKWLKTFYEVIALDGNNPFPMPCKHRIVAFDKMLNQDTGNGVTVAYELNETITSISKYHKPKNTVPLYA